MNRIILFFILCSFGASSAANQLSVTRTIIDNLSVPWGMALIAPNQVLVTQRDGDIVLVDLKQGSKQQVSGAPAVLAKGQGGLLDVKKSPNYAVDRWLYFTYVKPVRGQGATTLARARLKKTALVDWQDLLVTKSRTKHHRHYGSRIAFDGQGHVFFSVGDRGERSNAQYLGNHAGSILRLNLDGSVPRDNPFFGQPNVLPEIYSLGHRNPQGLAFDFKLKQLWAVEHGPRGGDELNLIQPGLNYGWPIVSHGKEYMLPIAVGEAKSKAGFVDPVEVYIPSIAPSSLLLVTKKSGLQQFFIGALKLTHVNELWVKQQKVIKRQQHLHSLQQRIRNVIAGENNDLLIATDSGQLLQVSINP